jgi:hypothetical protein
MKVEADKDLRTCHGILKTFSAKFKQLGKGRWLSGEIRADLGLCQVVIVFELTSKEGVWSLKENYISMEDSPACKAIADENRPLPARFYSWMGGESEPQCDFISWAGGVGPSLSP